MNEDGTPNEDQQIEAGAAGAPEGAVTDPTVDEVGKMYDELGIKAPKPTGKAKGRPKASAVRAKDVSAEDDGDSKSGRKEDNDSNSKPKATPDSDADGDSGDDTDSKGSKERTDSGEVSDESEEADGGVRGAKSKADRDSEPGSEEDSDDGDSGAGQEEHESDDEAEEGEAGKRPGKSNPKIEQRFQRLAEEKRERDQRIAELEREIQETRQQQQQAQISQEDPEYTIDDFRKVRDEDGNILDLDENEAELAWRRWQDGYNQRKTEREAQFHHEQEQERHYQETSERLMRSSVEAYDTLTGLLDEYPELNENSGQFDQAFSDTVLPIIEGAMLYAPGTEPGNEDGAQPVIVGFKIDPKMILEGMSSVKSAKRNLPLNGINDNVEVRSNVNVPHGRSSDPTVQAANDLYKELGINTRV